MEQTSILIVDDDTSMSKSMALILKRKGYEVTVAGSGPESIELIKTRPFDITFMDIKMPIMNGVEAFEEIKKIRPESVVIMMTAYAFEELIQKALQIGAYGIIQKPLDIDRMIKSIEEVETKGLGMLLMIVDDDPGTATTLKHILTRKGHLVAVASTGEDAIELAKVQDYDILFIDIKLPTINGLQTYLEIRKIRPDVIGIMITGYRQEVSELVDVALQQSAYTVLYKPFNMEALIEIVNEIEKKRKKARAQS